MPRSVFYWEISRTMVFCRSEIQTPVDGVWESSLLMTTKEAVVRDEEVGKFTQAQAAPAIYWWG